MLFFGGVVFFGKDLRERTTDPLLRLGWARAILRDQIRAFAVKSPPLEKPRFILEIGAMFHWKDS